MNVGAHWMAFYFNMKKFVKPSFEEYIFPTKKYADVIIPRGADNQVAINLLVQHIRTKLAETDPRKISRELKKSLFENESKPIEPLSAKVVLKQ